MKRFCKTCGAEIGEGTNICSICGSVYGQPQANDTTVLNENASFRSQQGNETTVLNQGPGFSAPSNNGFGNYSADNQSNTSKTPASNPHLQNPYMPKNSNVNNLNGQPLNTQNGASSNTSQYYNPPVASKNGFGQGNQYNIPNNASFPYQQATNYNPSAPTKKKKLSTGAIIGIVIGTIVVIGIIFTIICFAVIHSFMQNDYTMNDDPSESYTEDIEFGDITNGNLYINNFADLKLKLPGDEWEFLSKEEIYEHYLDLGINVNYDETTKETYMNDPAGTTYADAFLVNTADGSNVQIMLIESNSAFDTLNDYFSIIESELNSTYSDAYMDDVGIYTFGSNMYSVIEGGGTTNGVSIVQYYAGTNINGDFVIITATFEKNSAPGFMEFFESISAY